VNLAVLSACETGLGAPTSGEGLLGLGRALLQAGAGSVITSLWKVDDRATGLFFTEFYRYLWKEKKHPAEALRRVKLDMIHGRLLPHGPGKMRGSHEKPKKKPMDYASPYFWGSFVYYGVGKKQS
jgi:CHAT domain-containing protein